MFSRGRIVIGSGILVAAIALAVLTEQLVGPNMTSAEIVRIILGVCAIVYAGITFRYAIDGYTIQAFGHTLAGVGFAIVAVAGAGNVAWVGVILLSTGGSILLSDALQQDGQGRAAT